MNVIVIDDEPLALDNLLMLLEKTMPDSNIRGYLRPAEAFAQLKQSSVDIAFLDIQMEEISGIEFALRSKVLCPKLNIVFVTGYSQYAMEALALHASGYLLKPVTESDLQKELDNLRYPPPIPSTSGVRVQTFGSFEIFVDDIPLRMPMAKCKESLAYLVDRKGACVTVPELAGILWEDKPFDKTVQNNTHRVLSDMMKSLRAAGISDIVLKNRRDIAINKKKINCDYYQYLAGDPSYLNRFYGEYMSNYSWSEITLAELAQSLMLKYKY